MFARRKLIEGEDSRIASGMQTMSLMSGSMSVHSAGATGVAGVADRVAGGSGFGLATGLGGGLDSGLARGLGGGIGSGPSKGLGGGNVGGIGGSLVNGITGGFGGPGATVDYTQEQAVEMTERKTVLIR